MKWTLVLKMQIDQLTKKVTLLITHPMTNKEQYSLYTTLGHGADACPYQREENVGPEY